MATLAEDDFNRSDRDLDGDTLSDGSNTWAIESGNTATIVSQEAVRGSAANNVMYVDSMADVADVEVSIEQITTSQNGAVARQSSNNYYLGHTTGVVNLFKRVSGSFTQLGSGGSSIGINDRIGVRCDGTSISALLNGSIDVGPITDAAHSTGKAGFRMNSPGRKIDNFLAEDFGAPPAGVAGFHSQHIYRSLLAGGAR